MVKLKVGTMSELYLTQESLGEFLAQRVSNDFIFNKCIPDSPLKNRPDFRSESLRLIVEYDGANHYTKASRFLADKSKNRLYTELGYFFIRIPYFIQLDSDTIPLLFKKYTNDFSNFLDVSHGFISKSATLPADFCSLGIERFEEDLQIFNCAKQEIINSLKIKVQDLGNKYLVLPESLFNLLE
jgi:very-short-patch-repair endonuclease